MHRQQTTGLFDLIAELTTDEGLWLDIAALFTTARWPASAA